MPEKFKIEKEEFNILFPFHLLLNKSLTVIQAGKGFKKLKAKIENALFSDLFLFKRPTIAIDYSFESILQAADQLFILEYTGNKKKLMLRGQFMPVGSNMLLFAGSLWIIDVNDLKKFGLSIADFAIHDPVTDMLQALKVRELAMKDVQDQRDELIRKNQEIEDLARFPGENPNPVFRISITGKIRYANKASEVLMKAWKLKIGDFYPEELKSALRLTIQTSAPLETEITINDKHYSLLFTPFLENGYINVYGNDITEKKQTANILKESEERFKQLVEDASDIIYRTDFEGHFTYVNPIAERIINKRPEEISNVHFSELIREDWRNDVVNFYKLQFGKRVSRTYYEFPIIDSQGKEIWLGQHVKMLTQGKWILGFQAVARDITDRKRMEESLKMAKERAEESLRIKEDFMANMSHEIRTPMNGILGMSKLLSAANLSKKHRQYLDAIQTSANNLLVIINDILDLSKIEAGKLELELIGFNVKEVVESAVGSFEYSATQKGLSISSEIDEQLNEQIIQGDPTRLGQVLTNLIGNAIKFTEQGEVKIKCKLLHEDDRHVRLVFSVIDTGIGIAPDKYHVIFDSFSQADSSTTRKFGGTGLGLSICKRLIELQGGTINVKSKEGEGATFYFDIPYLKGKDKDLQETSEQARYRYNLNGVRALLVEDNAINQVYAMNILQDKDMLVDLAENGQEALELLGEKEYDIILMDIQMPVMGGIETTRAIRHKLKLKVPIIALTANAIKGEADKYLSVGMNEYVSKPFQDNELYNKIARLLNLSPIYAVNNSPLQHVNDSQEKSNGSSNKSYDLSKLQQMSGTGEEFVIRMVRMFIEEMPKSLTALNEYLDKKDYQKLKAVAHKMKPAIHIMGIQSIEADIRQIEECAENKQQDQLPAMVERVVSVCEEALQQLKMAYPS